MLLPLPVTTPNMIVQEIHISENSRKITNLCMPHIRVNNMRYDIFIDNVKKHKIKGICMTNNQKEADLLMDNDEHKNVYFPENYDITTFLLQNSVPIEFREVNDKLSVVDIISLMIQVAIVRIISQIFSIASSSNLFEEFVVKVLNSDLHSSASEYLYNFGKGFSKDDIKMIIRIINYSYKRNMRKLIRYIKL